MDKINGRQLYVLGKIADRGSLRDVSEQTLRALRRRGLIDRFWLTPKGEATVDLHRIALLSYVDFRHMYAIAE
jgi:hypothetical protein